MRSSRVQSFLAGMLVANSAPHLATAITGRRHLTPLAGKDSGPRANAVWAAANLVGGALLLRAARRRGERGWGGDLIAFNSGYATFASWMAGSERVLRINSRRESD